MTQPKGSGTSIRTQSATAAMRGLFSGDADTHLLDRLNAIYKHRYLVASVFALVFLGVVIRTFTTTPMYRATTSVLIEDERGASVAGFNAASGAEYYQDPEPYFQTQLRILQGRELAGLVVDRLHLQTAPEFNGQNVQRTGLAAVLDSLKRQLTAPINKLLGRPTADTAQPVQASRDALINKLLASIQLEPVRGSRLVNVAMISSNPAFAAHTSDALVEEYVRQNFKMRTESTQRSLDFLADEIGKQQQKVEETERALADYREHNNALSLDDRQNTVSASLNQLNDQYTRAKTERIQKETLYRQIEGLSPTTPQLDTIPAVTMNPGVMALRQRLADLQRERATLNERYGEKNPQVIANANQIEDANRQYQAALAAALGTIKTEYQTALRQETSLAAELNAQKGAAMDLNRKGVSYTVLEREAQSNRQIYEALLQRQKELQVVSNSGGNNVRLMDRAVPPGAPYTPDVKRNLALGAIAGALLALGLVLVIDYLDDTVKTPEDITRRLKLPFLGLVPAMKSGAGQPLLSQEVPHEFGEAFRALRTSLVFSSGVEGTRVIGITSAQPLEGKTTTACNMAIALAYGGSKVLLIDADMRRPSVSRTLGMENTIGLSHLLTGQATPRQAIRQTHVNNLWVMTAGLEPPNPSELLSSERMKTLIASVENGPFDWVLVDTPPVLAVTDAVIIAPWVSGMVFIIGSEMTQRRLAERAVETLMTSRPHVLGAVLNRVDIVRNKYYYSRYYGYKYKNYYVKSNAA